MSVGADLADAKDVLGVGIWTGPEHLSVLRYLATAPSGETQHAPGLEHCPWP